MMTQTALRSATVTVVETDTIALAPDHLPYDDGEPMESTWHRKSALLLEAGYLAAHGDMRTFFVGCTMFLHFRDNGATFKGPDFFVVKDVDGRKPRKSWIVWKEGGRYPDLIIELLSDSTEWNDLTSKKDIYERVFHTHEYFCIDFNVQRLMGWRHDGMRYRLLPPDERGWLWSEDAGLWLGPWQGEFLCEEHCWPRWYDQNGKLVLTNEEAALQQLAERETELARRETELAERETELASERERTERLAAKLRALGKELEE